MFVKKWRQDIKMTLLHIVGLLAFVIIIYSFYEGRLR